MKKLFLLFLGLSISSSIVAAQVVQPAQIEEPTEVELQEIFAEIEMQRDENDYWYPACEFDETEQQLLQMVIDLFSTHSEERIINRLFTTVDGKETVRSYTKEFISWVSNALAMCNGNYLPWYAPWNFEDFTSDLQKYVETLVALKTFEVTTLWGDPVGQSYAQLREIILWDSLTVDSLEWRSQQLTNMLMSFQMKDMYTDVDFKLDLDADTVWKNDGSVMKSMVWIWWEVKMLGDDGNIETSWEMSWEIRLVDGSMYLKLQDFDIDLGTIEFDNQYDAQWFNEMLAWVEVIQWKYIEIPLMPEWLNIMMNPMWMYGMWLEWLQVQQEMMMKVMQEDWLTTYHQEWNMIYGWLNPMACGSMKEMWMMGECLDAWMEWYSHTGWKWMFFMKSENGTTSMGITDVFTNDMPEELKSIANIPLITRDANEITSIEIPFKEDGVEFGSLKYNNWVLLLQWAFPDEVYDRETDEYKTQITKVNIRGNGIWTNMDIKWSITNPDLDITFSADISWDINNMKLQMMLDLEDKNEDYPSDINLEMILEQTNTIVPPQDITKPEDREILDMDVLL